jgi:hypothetical protein
LYTIAKTRSIADILLFQADFLGYSFTYVSTMIVKTCMPDVASIICVMTTAAINEKLAQFLREGQTWEKKPTNIQGVSLLKLPASKQSLSSIAIEINPTNATAAAAATTRKKGIIIRDGSELEQFNQLLSNPKVVELAKKIESVNPENKEATGRSSSTTDVFEI